MESQRWWSWLMLAKSLCKSLKKTICKWLSLNDMKSKDDVDIYYHLLLYTLNVTAEHLSLPAYGNQIDRYWNYYEKHQSHQWEACCFTHFQPDAWVIFIPHCHVKNVVTFHCSQKYMTLALTGIAKWTILLFYLERYPKVK